MVAGTVFRPPGFALSGAEVTVSPEPGPTQARAPKSQRVLSDARGEFVVRVPAVPMRYLVTVKKKGFVSQSRPASIEGEQRLELLFTLEPDAGKEDR